MRGCLAFYTPPPVPSTPPAYCGGVRVPSSSAAVRCCVPRARGCCAVCVTPRWPLCRVCHPGAAAVPCVTPAAARARAELRRMNPPDSSHSPASSVCILPCFPACRRSTGPCSMQTPTTGRLEQRPQKSRARHGSRALPSFLPCKAGQTPASSAQPAPLFSLPLTDLLGPGYRAQATRGAIASSR